MSASLGLILSPAPSSTRMRRPSPSSSRERMERRMRLRSSGGSSFDHRGLGTEPNIEPPSSHTKPVSSVWMFQAPRFIEGMRAEWWKAREPSKRRLGARLLQSLGFAARNRLLQQIGEIAGYLTPHARLLPPQLPLLGAQCALLRTQLALPLSQLALHRVQLALFLDERGVFPLVLATPVVRGGGLKVRALLREVRFLPADLPLQTTQLTLVASELGLTPSQLGLLAAQLFLRPEDLGRALQHRIVGDEITVFAVTQPQRRSIPVGTRVTRLLPVLFAAAPVVPPTVVAREDVRVDPAIVRSSRGVIAVVGVAVHVGRAFAVRLRPDGRALAALGRDRSHDERGEREGRDQLERSKGAWGRYGP